MDRSDRIFFARHAIDTELESIFEYDDPCDFDLNVDADQFTDETHYDGLDEYLWDDV